MSKLLKVRVNIEKNIQSLSWKFETFKFLSFSEKNLKTFSEINKFFLNSNFISLYLNQSILGRR